MPRDEFTAEAFFKGFTEGWTAAGGDTTVGSCPVPEPHFEEVEYLIDQVTTILGTISKQQCHRGGIVANLLGTRAWSMGRNRTTAMQSRLRRLGT